MHDISPVRIAELLDAYLLADYRWEFGGQWRRFSVGELATDIDDAFPDAQRYALLSAWDPYSITREEAVNRRQDELLHRSIVEDAYPCRAAFSSAPDRSWREPSWLAIDMSVDALDVLGRRFGQLGTLSWERGQRVRLRMDAAAPRGYAEFPCVDWLK